MNAAIKKMNMYQAWSREITRNTWLITLAKSFFREYRTLRSMSKFLESDNLHFSRKLTQPASVPQTTIIKTVPTRN